MSGKTGAADQSVGENMVCGAHCRTGMRRENARDGVPLVFFFASFSLLFCTGNEAGECRGMVSLRCSFSLLFRGGNELGECRRNDVSLVSFFTVKRKHPCDTPIQLPQSSPAKREHPGDTSTRARPSANTPTTNPCYTLTHSPIHITCTCYISI